jgi:multidrug transporter EmrE-like cation transporter
MNIQGLLLVILAGLNSCLGNLSLKYSRTVAVPDADFFSKMLNGYFMVGLAFYGINVVLFAKALDNAAVSVAYPVLAGSGFAMLAVASAVVFGERLSAQQLAGLVSLIDSVVEQLSQVFMLRVFHVGTIC